MERVTIRFPKEQLQAVEEMVEDGTFPNKSEAIRAATRDLTDKETVREGSQRTAAYGTSD